MLNHGVNGNALRLSFGTLSFHIAHPHSLLFQLLSEIIELYRRISHVDC
jgi:hypothetical protein